MKNILYIIDKPNLYGSELHMLDLVRYYKSKYNISVVAFDNGPLIARLTQLNIKVNIIHISWVPSIYAFKQLIRVVKDFSPNIIHSHQPKATFYGGVIGLFLNKKCVSTIHSTASDTSKLRGNKITKSIVILFHYLIQFISELLSNKVIFVSNSSQKNSFFKYKSVVIYNWVNNIQNKSTTKKISSKKVSLLTVGSVSLAKGFDFLLDFCSKLDANLYRISIVGDGEHAFVQGIKKRFLELDLEVEFLGFRGDPSIYFKRSDVFISLSRSETFGLAFAEAASFGLPIFARNLDVLHEILPDVNYFNNNNEVLIKDLNDLVKNPQLFKQISNTNFEWAKLKYSFEKNIQKLTNVYKSVESY